MSVLDIALALSVPLGAVVLTVTYRFRKKRGKRRTPSRQRTLL